MTREHVLPAWLTAIMPGGGPFMISFERGPTYSRTWSGQAIDVTVKKVCRHCNGGWMSGLETQAKELLSEMISGHTIMLSEAAQATVGLWATKTAMMFQYTAAPPALVPRIRLDHLYSVKQPPPNTYVWLAGFHGNRWVARYRGEALEMRRASRPGEVESGFLSTLVLGKMVLQVLACDDLAPT